ncbi:MAG TPA: hypothetical protein VGS11_11060 [Candidatus Bathyarchaeia archaeon]|nr:hypothetical protein [Candidatus Bathyarchaeia archaeon]
MASVCPECRSKDTSTTVVALGYRKCNACGHTESKVALSKTGKQDLVGSLIAIGAIALGAVLVGALVDSMLDGPKGSIVRKIDSPRLFE